MTAIEILKAHIPSMSPDNEDEILDRATNVIGTDELDVADLAIRTCSCGQRIDGFYEYVEHIKEVLA